MWGYCGTQYLATELAVERRHLNCCNRSFPAFIPGLCTGPLNGLLNRVIDAVLIGPGDLSISLGVPGEFGHPQFVAAVETIRDRCDRAGIAPGLHMRSLELGKEWRGRGLRLFSCNSDLGFLFDKATETVAALKSQISQGDAD